MDENSKQNNQLSDNELLKENKNLKRRLRNLELTLQRNQSMLAARATINSILETEQQRMERNMSLLLQNSADIILLFDKNGRFTDFSHTFLTKTGIAVPSLIKGRHFTEIFSSLVPKEWTNLIQMNYALALGRRSTSVITSSVDLSGRGSPKDYDIQITPMMDKDGKLEATMMLFHDITDTVRAKRQAESASMAKSQFLATMSHEMRTPMNAVLGMTSIGKAASDKERMVYCFSKIEDASQHLLGVINDILDMSKIEAKKFNLSPTDFSFERMFQKVVNVVNFRISDKKQHFSVHIDEAIPRVLHGDDQRLAQVITNILGNAVKFTPDGGTISLNAGLISEDDNICTIRITVADTGIGMNPEQQGRLFQSFQQAESDTARKFGGTGLGLSISKSIVEMMGGEISVVSEANKGTVLSFTVQLRKTGKQAHALIPKDANWSKLRILAIDSDLNTLAFLQSIVQGFGINCDTASYTEDALWVIEQNGAYDIYFISLTMSVLRGDLNGIELTDKLKSMGYAPDNPRNSVVIMCSDAEWISVEAEAKAAGIERFITKPLFQSTVLDIISECAGIYRKQEHDATPENTDLFSGYRILLAEDVEINREIVLALLEPTQVEIDYAENGSDAVNMFSKAPEKYDMILMDIQMPLIDGYEATRRIRALAHPQAKSIPIVALTANVFRDDVEKCLDAGMNGHIGKPLNINELLQQLRRYLTN